ncbi:transcriptional regulator [soil metagenome]
MTDLQPLTDLLGDTRARIVTALQREPLTAAELAGHLAITAAAVRRHLTALTADGLVKSDTVRDGSMGRPRDAWSLTERGKRLFPNRSAEFADELLEHLEATYGRAALGDFLKARAERHADRYADELADVTDPAERVHQLAQALSDDGFAAHVVSSDNGRSLALLQSHCAIEGIATRHPEVCAHEAALFRRLLGTKVSRRDTIAGGAQACVCHIDIPVERGRHASGDLQDSPDHVTIPHRKAQ